MQKINHMSNNRIKKRAAEAFNKKRKEAHDESVRVAQDKIDNPELVALVVDGKYNFKNQSERLAYLGKNWSGNGYWHQFEKVDEPGVVWSEMQDSDLHMLERTVEEPKLIANWVELTKVPDSATHSLDIKPEDGNGWVREIGSEDIGDYLSTHTFYGLNHEYSTKLLQSYGFNVILTNWDER